MEPARLREVACTSHSRTVKANAETVAAPELVQERGAEQVRERGVGPDLEQAVVLGLVRDQAQEVALARVQALGAAQGAAQGAVQDPAVDPAVVRLSTA